MSAALCEAQQFSEDRRKHYPSDQSLHTAEHRIANKQKQLLKNRQSA